MSNHTTRTAPRAEPPSEREQARKQFEAWIARPPYERETHRQGQSNAWPGQYHDYQVQLAWEAWQSALASLPPGDAPPASAYEDDEPSSVPEGTLDAWSAPLRRPVVPKILSTDDFYALLRILEVLPIADPFLTTLQSKLSDEERRQHGNQASHLSGSEFVREIERVEALIQSRVVPP